METTAEIVGKAIALLRSRRWAEAEKLLSEAVSAGQQDPRISAALADALTGSGRSTEAMAKAVEALKRWPQDYSLLISAGNAALASGEHGEAVCFFQSALAVVPTPYGFSRLARALVAAGDFKAAMRAVESGLKLKPGYRALLQLKATIHLKLGEGEKALGELEEARRISPQDQFLERQYVAQKLKDLSPDRAASELGAMMRVSPYRENPHLWELYGSTLDKASRHEEAETALRRAIELQPGNAFLIGRLGFFLYRQGRFGEAKQYLSTAFLKKPSDQILRSTMLKAFEEAGDVAGLLSLLDKAIEEHPGIKPLLGIRKKYAKRLETGPEQ